MTIKELAAGEITITNTSKKPQTVMIYIPNKDSIPYVIAPDADLKVTTLSAGETFTYLMQNTSDLKITNGTEDSQV